ncbi:MAG: glycerate kinase [Firmicutes bacterium]|nr:glycerate kinase [Bacillota bacterium]
MKIVVAPDSFKGSLSATRVAECIGAGIKKADAGIEVKMVPIADGGEGTVEAVLKAAGGKIIETSVVGPRGTRIPSFFGILEDDSTAVVEIAAAAGLGLLPGESRNPLLTTSYGVGELILEALNRGCSKIIVGLGGSATNDGGMGMARALGAIFYDRNGTGIGSGGQDLERVASMDMDNIDPRLKDIKIIGAYDVNSPFHGPEGAAFVFAPQKGADEDMVRILDRGLKIFATTVAREMGIDLQGIPGSGAAGGMAGGLLAFTGAVLKPGMEILSQICNLEKEIAAADMVITGEGQTDAQTAFGKVPVGVAAIAGKYNIPVVCLSGGLGEGFEKIYNLGITAAFSCINNAMTLEEAMAGTEKLLAQAAFDITRLIKARPVDQR